MRRVGPPDVVARARLAAPRVGPAPLECRQGRVERRAADLQARFGGAEAHGRPACTPLFQPLDRRNAYWRRAQQQDDAAPPDAAPEGRRVYRQRALGAQRLEEIYVARHERTHGALRLRGEQRRPPRHGALCRFAVEALHVLPGQAAGRRHHHAPVLRRVPLEEPQRRPRPAAGPVDHGRRVRVVERVRRHDVHVHVWGGALQERLEGPPVAVVGLVRESDALGLAGRPAREDDEAVVAGGGGAAEVLRGEGRRRRQGPGRVDRPDRADGGGELRGRGLVDERERRAGASHLARRALDVVALPVDRDRDGPDERGAEPETNVFQPVICEIMRGAVARPRAVRPQGGGRPERQLREGLSRIQRAA